MKSTSEKGHAKNVANFNLLITQIDEMGTLYNPSNTNLAKEQLVSLYNIAVSQQHQVNELYAPYAEAVAARENTFLPINKLTTKIGKVFKSTQGVEANQLENFMGISRKIKGSKKEATTTENQHSSSQLSYDQRTNNMDKLILLLENTPQYNPNEEAYKITTLRTVWEDMKTKTLGVNQKYVPLNNARSQRNNTLYSNTNSLVDIAYKVKDYVFSLLDSQSVQYKSIARIKFSRM